MIAMSYGNIYVAKVSMANPAQVVKAFIEADAYDGPSLILAYSHCIAHGIAMDSGVDRCKDAVNSGHWQLFRYDPRRAEAGQNPLQIDSKDPSMTFEDFASVQNRFRVLKKINPEAAETLMAQANKETAERVEMYKHLAAMKYSNDSE